MCLGQEATVLIDSLHPLVLFLFGVDAGLSQIVLPHGMCLGRHHDLIGMSSQSNRQPLTSNNHTRRSTGFRGLFPNLSIGLRSTKGHNATGEEDERPAHQPTARIIPRYDSHNITNIQAVHALGRDSITEEMGICITEEIGGPGAVKGGGGRQPHRRLKLLLEAGKVVLDGSDRRDNYILPSIGHR